ncbi:WD40 repeat-like protein [Suillus weaverae]|nr:WD40 repeat-like protein [Suillus weaverae]
MSSAIGKKQQTPAVAPRHKMRGHTHGVRGVVYLRCGQRIITCSGDGSLRLWDLESATQIGHDWRDGGDEEDETGVTAIALSPNGNTIGSGYLDGKVRLWDVETGKVTAKWTGHTRFVRAVCWSPDGGRVASGYQDGTARVWALESGDSETVLGPIKTGHQWVWAIIYSPDSTKIATSTGGFDQSTIKIWNAKTGELLATLDHDPMAVHSFAWTSDEKKLISGSFDGSIRIFETATWQQIAILEGHKRVVYAISLSRNDCLLASVSCDETARLWNLDTNLPVGQPLPHNNRVECATFSDDGKLLVTGCWDKSAYVWDTHAILKEAGLQDLLSLPDESRDRHETKVAIGKSLIDSDARRCPDQLKDTHQLPRGLLDDAQDSVHSPVPRGTYAHFSGHRPLTPSGSPRALLDRISLPFSRSQPSEIEMQRQKPSTIPRCDLSASEVATVTDKQPEHWDYAKQTQRKGRSQGQPLALPIHSRFAATSKPPPSATSTITLGAAGTRSQTALVIRQPTWWTRFLLSVCCVSAEPVDGHQ